LKYSSAILILNTL